ncbi:DUF922 domain-containing protein [Pedobacter helvus]|uniref:DUF922 domain-containing protein n=1 Tax=Pedobacter helvus TaxID=2563444 RepID=A0ABW9JET9_9SPHI|nr:hypothetical protein [Pedobacter ureilyticus]
MKPLKNIILLLLAVFACAFIPHERIYPETINWDTHFKGNPDPNSHFAAVTSTIWQYGYRSTIRGNNLQLEFNFLGGVDANKSWVKRERIRNKEASSRLLNHEQGHVYINFILLKKGEYILKNQSYTVSNYKRLIDKTAKDISKFYSDMQERYDVETKHGSDLEAQKKWDAFFESELSQL